MVTDLPGAELGRAIGNTIYFDGKAAGQGWFIDATARTDEESAGSGFGNHLRALDPQAVDRIDLLIVVEHELGHLLGLADLKPSVCTLMSAQLKTGIRRMVGPKDPDAAFVFAWLGRERA